MGLLSEVIDEGQVKHNENKVVRPSLSTGVYTLDQALETHLNLCKVLLEVGRLVSINTYNYMY